MERNIKRFFIFSLVLLACIKVQAQSVLGIDFGSDYQTVLDDLQARFGSDKIEEKDGEIRIYGLTMGDINFNYGSFSFQRSGSSSYFNAAHFETHFKTSEVTQAKNARDYLFDTLKDKYVDDYVGYFINKQGFKCYQFGENPQDKDYALGDISLERRNSNDNRTRLYLFLDYGPIYYIDKASDF